MQSRGGGGGGGGGQSREGWGKGRGQSGGMGEEPRGGVGFRCENSVVHIREQTV